MHASRLLKLDLRKSAKRLRGSALSVVVSAALALVLAGLGLGLYQELILPLIPKLPLGWIRVVPAELQLGIFGLDATGMSGGLSDQSLKAVAKEPGVRAAYGVRGSAFPMRATGGASFLGRSVYVDIFATGIDPALVQADVAQGQSFGDQPGEVVPVLVAKRLLKLFNSSIAPALKKPKLTEELLVGFEFELQLGVSHSQGVPDPSRVKRLRARIVGFSERANLVGITVPQALLESWNQSYQGSPGPFVEGLVELSDPRQAAAVALRLEQRGLHVEDGPKQIGLLVAVAAGIYGVLVLILLGLSMFGISASFHILLAERRRDFAVLRALGASKRQLTALLLKEAVLVGALSGVLGSLLGAGLALGLERWLLALLPKMAFLPDKLMALPFWLLALGPVLGAAAAALGALVPARRLAESDPMVLLRD